MTNTRKLLLVSAMGFVLMAGSCEDTSTSTAIEKEAAEANQQSLIAKYPVPLLSESLERKNLIERAERINQQNLVGCIYLISYGTVMATYPVDGKVSSLNSYLLSSEKPYWTGGSNGNVGYPIEQADIDGAYGKNADGVFFFTADTNAYVEWQGEYLWSDQCLALSVQPKLVRQIGEDD